VGRRGSAKRLTVRIRRLSFLGLKTDAFETMATFVRDVLGLEPGHMDEGWAVFQLASGDRDLLEVYRPGAYDERLLPAAAAGLTVAFGVDDLVAARDELVAAGTEIVADVIWADEAFGDPAYVGFGWLFFRAPDGNVYALQQDQARSDSTDRGAA
jgi:catechol 2,3-dioxygenase-like lactoylglutathione lyase family enzyme